MKIKNIVLTLVSKEWAIDVKSFETKKQEILAEIAEFVKNVFVADQTVDTRYSFTHYHKVWYYEAKIQFEQETIAKDISLKINMNGTKEITEQLVKFAAQQMVNNANNIAELIKNSNNEIVQNLAKDYKVLTNKDAVNSTETENQ